MLGSKDQMENQILEKSSPPRLNSPTDSGYLDTHSPAEPSDCARMLKSSSQEKIEENRLTPLSTSTLHLKELNCGLGEGLQRIKRYQEELGKTMNVGMPL